MKKLLIITTVTVIFVVAFLYSRKNIEAPIVSPTATPTPTPTLPVLSPTPTMSKVFVTYLDSGYSPATVTVKKGDTITFDNKSLKMMWTASALHPTHKIYPGSDIVKCGTGSQAGIFDACRGYNSGESWEFQFNHQGTWKYHNHLQPNHGGMVVVE